MKQLLALYAAFILIFSIMANAQEPPSPEINIKTELASPVILENTQDNNYLKVSLTGFPQEKVSRSPINLTLIIDRSTSMRGDRIEKAREAAILTINMLNSDDILSVIAYDNNASVVIPATKVTDKDKLIKLINKHIQPTGMTALFAGVSKGLDEVKKNLHDEYINRIILISDGQANTGPTSISELSELSRKAARAKVAISTIGLGDDYNEDLMTAIANYSDGNHFFVSNSSDLEKAFVKEFKDVMSVVAQDVEITITLKNGSKPVRLLGYEGEISNKKVKVNLNQLYANQEKYVLLEVVPPNGNKNEEKSLADVTVTYNNQLTKKSNNFNKNVSVRYSDSSELVKSSMIEDVIVDVAIQKTAIANDEAVRQIDLGNVQAAQSIVESNIEMLNQQFEMATFDETKEKIEKAKQENNQISSSIQNKSVSHSRKELKEKIYTTKAQQKK